MAFPTSPTEGQTHNDGQQVWEWKNGFWRVRGLAPTAPYDPNLGVDLDELTAALAGQYAPLAEPVAADHIEETTGAHDATAVSVADVFYAGFTVPDVSAALVLLSNRAMAAGGLGRAVVIDSFNRAGGPIVSADFGGDWTDHLGDWEVVDGTAQATRTASGNRYLSIDAGVANVVVDATIKWTDNFAGIAVRGVAATTYLYARVAAGVVGLRKVVSNTQTELASAAVGHTSGATHRYSVRVFGNVVTVRRDGDLLLTHTLTGGDETTFAAGTQVGLASNAPIVRPVFDDFIARRA